MTAADDCQTRSGDVLVVFGITGDLARVMTFRSLYRLEQRGLLNCPVVGVAVVTSPFTGDRGGRIRVASGPGQL
jgi:glucose-6-phosphate 1-dehydrogenase